MKKFNIKKSIILIVSALALIGLDQFFKHLAVEYLKPIGSKVIIKNIFSLTYIQNDGAAFGLFAGNKFLLIWLTALVLLCLIIAVFLNKIKSNFLFISFILIIGGGIGNLIDRIFLGYVVDYLHITCINFAIFNFADCCVVIGTILLIIYFLFFDNKNALEKPCHENNEENING